MNAKRAIFILKLTSATSWMRYFEQWIVCAKRAAFGIFHLLWLILCPSVCADWVSAHVCYLTSSPFSPPGRHTLKSRCGWSHACSERLRETEHNSDFNTTESHIIHTPCPPTHQTNHSGHMNDFHPSLKSISSFLVIYAVCDHWSSEWCSGNWRQKQAHHLWTHWYMY